MECLEVVRLRDDRYWSFDIDGLFSYSPAATGNSDYTHKFLFEGDFSLKLGKMVNAKSNWSDLSAYAMLQEQSLALVDQLGYIPPVGTRLPGTAQLAGKRRRC